MLRGIPGESPSGNHAHANANSNANSNSNAEEEELEHEILMEILEEGRGEREEQGEREEWKEHVGWHRKENVGVLRHGSKTATHVHRSGEHAADSVVGGAGADAASASASAGAASADAASAAARKPLRGSRHGVADTDDGRLPSAFVAPTAEPGWESELEFHFSLLSVVVRVLLGIVLALAASRCMARGVSRRFVLSADGMGNRRRSSKERTL